MAGDKDAETALVLIETMKGVVLSSIYEDQREVGVWGVAFKWITAE